MDVGTVLSVAQTLLATLQSSELKTILSIFGYKTQLDDLQHTVGTINVVLRDAETKQELNHEQQHWIEELKNAVFEADDLFDEFATLAEQKQLVEASGKLSKKVNHFFSRSHNPLSLAYRMSRGVKDIRKKLDAIASNSQQFSFKIDPEPIRKRRHETCSYVNEVDIIGRDNDLETIVGELLASNDQHDMSFLTVVGIGGLGKTTLAQLVYNDRRITNAFPLRLWTCVADQDQKELDVKEILCKILGKRQEGSTMEQVQSQVREQLAGKKLLLVLDDVWTEKRDQWCEFVKYLVGGENGSWIVVTTRSQHTATIIGGLMYELQGLSKENSWRLFEKTAFGSQSNPTEDLVKIGREVVDGCARVPLAIRVAGSLLYGQHKSKWQSFQKIGLANIRESENGIMRILKLSFHHLETPLKSCFSYCAVFPKDFVMEKDMLLSLWIAQGYIIPFDEGQSIEDAAEEYFSILLRRCFFQDIEKDDIFGEIISCKIHDLMHDVAQSVAGKEIYAMNSICDNLDKNVRHLSIDAGWENGKQLSGKIYIRSCLFLNFFIRSYQFAVEASVVNCRCLRALDLRGSMFISLPCSIGELLHLRYLDLSYNPRLEVLPKSITKLYNLQALKLNGCSTLKELPKDLSRLVKLKVLEIRRCNRLVYMPRGMNKLSSLQRLSDYIVRGDEGSSSSSWKQLFDGLEDLKALNNLKGDLNIKFWWPKDVKNVGKQDYRRGGLYLNSKEHLKGITFNFLNLRMDDADARIITSLTEELQPHSNLEQLEVLNYLGVRMPSWATLLPNLVSLCLCNCTKLENLSCVGNLRHLKWLKLYMLTKLEYLDELGSSLEEVSFLPILPSLVKLELEEMPKLKGWRRGEKDKRNSSKPQLQRLSLPHLTQLKIKVCPKLSCILLCPNVELLTLFEFNKDLRVIYNSNLRKDALSSSIASTSTSTTPYSEIGNPSMSLSSRSSNPEISASSSSCTILVPKLKKVYVDNVAWLNTLPMEALRCLEKMTILRDYELVELPNWMQYLAALQTLEVCTCQGLKAMPNWMPKLTSLRKLKVDWCSKSLESRCQKDPAGEDWPYIQHISNIQFRYSV